MKTIHEQIIELLDTINDLATKGIDARIYCLPMKPEPIPKEFTESLAKGFLPRILKFYENEENMKKYMQWKSKQEECKKVTA